MPCNDVTDFVKIQLNPENRIITYKLAKRTCGAEVGEYDLIGDWAKAKSVDELLTLTPDAFLAANPPQDETEEFLFLKHFLAIQGALKAFLGVEPCGDKDPCCIDGVDYGQEGIEFRASVKVGLLTDQIKACGNCGCHKARPSSQ